MKTDLIQNFSTERTSQNSTVTAFWHVHTVKIDQQPYVYSVWMILFFRTFDRAHEKFDRTKIWILCDYSQPVRIFNGKSYLDGNFLKSFRTSTSTWKPMKILTDGKCLAVIHTYSGMRRGSALGYEPSYDIIICHSYITTRWLATVGCFRAQWHNSTNIHLACKLLITPFDCFRKFRRLMQTEAMEAWNEMIKIGYSCIFYIET